MLGLIYLLRQIFLFSSKDNCLLCPSPCLRRLVSSRTQSRKGKNSKSQLKRKPLPHQQQAPQQHAPGSMRTWTRHSITHNSFFRSNQQPYPSSLAMRHLPNHFLIKLSFAPTPSSPFVLSYLCLCCHRFSFPLRISLKAIPYLPLCQLEARTTVQDTTQQVQSFQTNFGASLQYWVHKNERTESLTQL